MIDSDIVGMLPLTVAKKQPETEPSPVQHLRPKFEPEALDQNDVIVPIQIDFNAALEVESENDKDEEDKYMDKGIGDGTHEARSPEDIMPDICNQMRLRRDMDEMEEEESNDTEDKGHKMAEAAPEWFRQFEVRTASRFNDITEGLRNSKMDGDKNIGIT